MAQACYRPEQIILMLREAKVEIGMGMTVRDFRRNPKIRQRTGITDGVRCDSSAMGSLFLAKIAQTATTKTKPSSSELEGQ